MTDPHAAEDAARTALNDMERWLIKTRSEGNVPTEAAMNELGELRAVWRAAVANNRKAEERR